MPEWKKNIKYGYLLWSKLIYDDLPFTFDYSSSFCFQTYKDKELRQTIIMRVKWSDLSILMTENVNLFVGHTMHVKFNNGLLYSKLQYHLLQYPRCIILVLQRMFEKVVQHFHDCYEIRIFCRLERFFFANSVIM